MKTYGIPEKFWVVTKPSPSSELDDICFSCTFERLMLQVRGGLREDEIVAVYANGNDAREAATKLLGEHPVRPQDASFMEILVNVMAKPIRRQFTARELAEASLEAVGNAVRQGEEVGFRHRLAGEVALGVGTVELRSLLTAFG